MAMHISKYCEVFDMKHLWSIWMHLNQLYVAKIYRLLWKLIVEAFASLSTCFSWYFDRDKYKLWFRSRRLTPFKSVCLTLLSINMTELACDCHPFFTHRNLQSNGWNIFFFRYWRQTAWLATAMLVADASRVLLIAAFIGISSSYPNGWLQRLKHSKLRFYILALINDHELQISRTYDMIWSRIYFGVYHKPIDMLQGLPVAVVRQGIVGEGGELITSETIVTRG